MGKALLGALVALAFATKILCKELAEVENSLEHLGDGTERIIGGTDTVDGEFPSAVALYFNSKYICAGSLLSPTLVLTAAHCAVFLGQLQPANRFFGIAGSANRFSKNATRLIFDNVTVHPEYEPINLANDLAYFQMNSKVELSPNLQPVCLPKPSTSINPYLIAYAVGWGTIEKDKINHPAILQRVKQKLFLHLFCLIRYGKIISEKQFCGDGFGKGICEGDSGGPLISFPPFKRAVQIGVASFVSESPGCGSIILSPGVFTRLSFYTNWIRESSQDPDICVV